MPMIKISALLCGGARHEWLEVDVSERPSSEDSVMVYPTQVDPKYGYTVALLHQGDLRVIGAVEAHAHA